MKEVISLELQKTKKNMRMQARDIFFLVQGLVTLYLNIILSLH